MNPSTDSPGHADATFVLRWRGRTQGPFSLADIERQLAVNEIGMLHEIQADGGWKTVRDFFQERDAARRAEQARREEAERLAHEQAARAAEERAARQQAEMLVEEKRRNDLMAAAMGMGHAKPLSWVKVFRNVALVLCILSIGMALFQAQRLPTLEAHLTRLKSEAAALKIEDKDLMTMAGFSIGFQIGQSLFDRGTSISDALERGLRDAAQNVTGELAAQGMKVEAYRNAILQCASQIEYATIARNWSFLIAALTFLAVICLHFLAPKRRTL